MPTRFLGHSRRAAWPVVGDNRRKVGANQRRRCSTCRLRSSAFRASTTVQGRASSSHSRTTSSAERSRDSCSVTEGGALNASAACWSTATLDKQESSAGARREPAPLLHPWKRRSEHLAAPFHADGRPQRRRSYGRRAAAFRRRRGSGRSREAVALVARRWDWG